VISARRDGRHHQSAFATQAPVLPVAILESYPLQSVKFDLWFTRQRFGVRLAAGSNPGRPDHQSPFDIKILDSVQFGLNRVATAPASSHTKPGRAIKATKASAICSGASDSDAGGAACGAVACTLRTGDDSNCENSHPGIRVGSAPTVPFRLDLPLQGSAPAARRPPAPPCARMKVIDRKRRSE
jgi:hypothetical protein